MKLQKWLTGAGIFNIVIGILMFLMSRFTFIPVIFLILSGFYYRTFFTNEEIYNKKSILLIIGIVNLVFNFISGIIALEVYALLDKDNEIKTIENKKNNKINMLLQLGIVLVLLSGIMIATNQTLAIPNSYKIIGLLFLSIIFFLLSYMSKKYLKLESSIKTYFLLGMSFIIISFVGLYYYNLLGSISYNGINYLYFYPLLFLLFSICSYISGKVLNMESLYYITIVSAYITLYNWFNALGIDIILNLTIITLTTTMINFIYNPSCLATKITTKSSYYISLILILINTFACLTNEFNTYSYILCLLTPLNIFHLLYKKKNNLLNIVSLPTLLINSSLITFMGGLEYKIELVIYQVILIILYNIIKFIKLEQLNLILKNIYKIIFNFNFIIIGFISLFVDSNASLIITTLTMIQSIIGLICAQKEEYYLEPFKSMLFIISLLITFNINRNVDLVFNIFIIEIAQLLLYIMMKNKHNKNIHYILYIILVGLAALNQTDNLFLSLISIISSLIPLIITIFKKEQSEATLIVSLVALLITNSNPIFKNICYLNYLFVFVLLLLYAYQFRQNRTRKYLSLFASSILLISFTNIMNFEYAISCSLTLLILSYIGALIMSSFSEKESKDIFGMIFSIVICLMYLFSAEILINLTIGIITITMVIFGVIKDFKKIKITGIILFILNLIYMLKDFWKDIPLAIYLLIIGLILIGVVIIKEIKENK